MKDLRRLFPYVRPYLPLLSGALVLLVLSGLLETVIIMLLAPIMNQFSPGAGPQGRPDKFAFLQNVLGLHSGGLPWIALLLVIFALFKGTFLYFADYSMTYVGQQVVSTLRKKLNAHLLEQSLAFYAVHPVGKLISRVISDTERLQETVSRTFADFLRQVFLLLFFLGLVFYTSWQLALLAFLVGPVVLGITVKLGRRIRSAASRSQENLSELHHALQETMQGQRVVKSFSMEEQERRRFDRLNDELVGVNLKAARMTALSSPLIEFIGYVSFVPFLLYVNFQIEKGISIGSFVVFVAALFRLYEPIRKLSRMHLYFQQAFASSSRIFTLLETPVEITDRPEARELPGFRNEIAFRDVSFHYQGRKEVPVLHRINLEIKRGEIVALVGSSGAGKTTLASLIPRFFEVTSGDLTIDGSSVRDVTLQSLRRQIAVVTQDTFLFSDTVRNNIAYGCRDCSMEEIVRAARAAFIHDFVLSLPRGYDTPVADQRLSGGQRQRMAIARAILKDAPILILDEATSSLDSESERLVQEALYNLMKQRTTLVIAHRLSTVRQAHRIVVMEGGAIVETGTHESLIERSGRYRHLYDLQFTDAGLIPT